MADEKEGEENNMKLVIPREKWARGRPSALYEPDSKKSCCVGLYLQSCGLATEALCSTRVANSMYLRDIIPSEAQWLLGVHKSAPSDIAAELYQVNDAIMNEEEREAYIAERFMSGGNVEVEFI